MRTRTTTAALIGAVLLAGIVGCAPEGADTDSESATYAPAYKILKRDGSGNSPTNEIEVDGTEKLRAVIDDALSEATDDAAYFVTINCSGGGTVAVDNRLADGDREFDVPDGRSCPSKAPSPTASSAFLRPTPEQEKDLVAELTAIDPALTVEEGRAISRSVSVCDDIRKGEDKGLVIKNAAYRYRGGTSVDGVEAWKIVAVIVDTYCTS
ncbi:hypothetical protein [Streptomyces sp. NPDC056987]|uniref:hypothetical protein n=1 Tax=Streptomyces sp. NPDC056987 TaxID=3345988 RepID=UPI003627999B